MCQYTNKIKGNLVVRDPGANDKIEIKLYIYLQNMFYMHTTLVTKVKFESRG